MIVVLAALVIIAVAVLVYMYVQPDQPSGNRLTNKIGNKMWVYTDPRDSTLKTTWNFIFQDDKVTGFIKDPKSGQKDFSGTWSQISDKKLRINLGGPRDTFDVVLDVDGKLRMLMEGRPTLILTKQ